MHCACKGRYLIFFVQLLWGVIFNVIWSFWTCQLISDNGIAIKSSLCRMERSTLGFLLTNRSILTSSTIWPLTLKVVGLPIPWRACAFEAMNCISSDFRFFDHFHSFNLLLNCFALLVVSAVIEMGSGRNYEALKSCSRSKMWMISASVRPSSRYKLLIKDLYLSQSSRSPRWVGTLAVLLAFSFSSFLISIVSS